MLVVEPRLPLGRVSRRQREPGALRRRASSSTCASRRGKPGVEGAKALEAYAAQPESRPACCWSRCRGSTARRRRRRGSRRSPRRASPSPSTRSSATTLPAWIAARLARQQQRATPETLAFLADRCEGNLLAARQEIEKLGLLLPEGELAHDAVERAVADVARYDVFQLSEAWLAGDAARARAHHRARSRPRARAPARCSGSSARTCTRWRRCSTATAAGTPASAARAQRARLGQAAGGDGTRGAAAAAGRGDAAAARARAARRAVEGHRPRQRLGRAAHAGARARRQAGVARRRSHADANAGADGGTRQASPQSTCIAASAATPASRRAARAARALHRVPAGTRRTAAISCGANPPSGPTSSATGPAGAATPASDRAAPGTSARPRPAPAGEPVGERHRRADLGHAVAPALLAGGDRHLLPVRRRRSPRSPPGSGALRAVSIGCSAVDAELGRLAHRVVHRVVGDDRLRERHRERRLALDRIEALDAHRRPALVDLKDRRQRTRRRARRTAPAIAPRQAAAPAPRGARPRRGAAASCPRPRGLAAASRGIGAFASRGPTHSGATTRAARGSRRRRTPAMQREDSSMAGFWHNERWLPPRGDDMVSLTTPPGNSAPSRRPSTCPASTAGATRSTPCADRTAWS